VDSKTDGDQTMSILKVDTINEKTSGNGVHIPGHVVQFVSTDNHTKQVITTNQSSGFTDISGTVSITPTKTSSKIYVRIVLHGGNITSGLGIDFRILRDSTVLKHFSNIAHRGGSTISNGNVQSHVIEYIDSPSSTSAHTYKWQIAFRTTNSGTFTINDDSGATSGASVGQTIITAMEIAQ
jgi:hypothetical protein